MPRSHNNQPIVVSAMHPSLISASELQSHLGKSIVVLDCRFNLTDKSQGLSLYRQGHIPGAYYVDLERDLSSPAQVHGGRHPLPNVEHLQQKLRSFGVNQFTIHAWPLLRVPGGY